MEYLAKMRRDQEWVDTAFLHALGRAYGVNALIIQAHTDETLVGARHEHHTPIVVPVALVNDQHFWGVLPCAHVDAIEPVDKGEHTALWSQGVEGLCPNPPHRRGEGLCPSPSGCDHDAAEDPNGLDDGEPPNVAFPDDRPPSNAAIYPVLQVHIYPSAGTPAMQIEFSVFRARGESV